MSYTYLASPYTHHDHSVMSYRYIEAMRCVVWLLERKQWVFSPIVHNHELAQIHDLPPYFDHWEGYSLAMLEKAERLLILALRGWQDSEGIRRETEIATGLHLPIQFITPPNYDITREKPK